MDEITMVWVLLGSIFLNLILVTVIILMRHPDLIFEDEESDFDKNFNIRV